MEIKYKNIQTACASGADCVYFTGMISHRYKLIFIHIPKCAGRSISDALSESFDHCTATYYQTTYPDLWNEYTIFTTLRNPYQRLVSMYHYITKEPFHANHAITGYGNMMPFKEWVLKNLSAFTQPFKYDSPEGNRETDGDIGSPFWFSSQARRISNASGIVYNNIYKLRYEDGMKKVEDFLQQHTGFSFSIAHLNNSRSNSQRSYLSYYDEELLAAVHSFAPFASDCDVLGYRMIDKISDRYLTA